MNDQFLHDYRRPSRKSSIQRLLHMMEPESVKIEKKINWRKPALIGATALILTIGIAIMVSPAVQAQVNRWIKQVGTILYVGMEETAKPEDYPQTPLVAPTPARTGRMSLEEARAVVPFAFDLPEWVPDGYELQPEVVVTYHKEVSLSVFLTWTVPSQSSGVTLMIQQRLDGYPGLYGIGENSSQEVKVNGEPAALVHGAWINDGKEWAADGPYSLYWPHHEQTYSLYAPEQIGLKNLLRIAESIP